MNESLILQCPAKLNLTLEVLSKQSNGMHEIESHFQLINLFDRLTIQKTENQFSSVKTNALVDIDNENNIAYQAIEALSGLINQDLYCDVFI